MILISAGSISQGSPLLVPFAPSIPTMPSVLLLLSRDRSPKIPPPGARDGEAQALAKPSSERR